MYMHIACYAGACLATVNCATQPLSHSATADVAEWLWLFGAEKAAQPISSAPSVAQVAWLQPGCHFLDLDLAKVLTCT
jgi:hypothetical protein